MKLSVKDFLVNVINKIHIFVCSLLSLLKEYLIENFIFCVVVFFTVVFYFIYPSSTVSAVHIQVPKIIKICRKAILSCLIISR